MPEACARWVAYWLPAESCSVIAKAGAPWTAERVVQWTLFLVDVATRQVAATLLELAGDAPRAAAHRGLPPVRDPGSGVVASRQLEESLRAARKLNLRPQFFQSVQLALEEALRLQRESESGHAIDANALEGLFGKAGFLDMAMHRAIPPSVESTSAANQSAARDVLDRYLRDWS